MFTKLLTILMLCAGAGSAAAQTRPLPPPSILIYEAPAENQLKEFTSADKSFSATFPGTPRSDSTDMGQVTYLLSNVRRSGSNSSVGVFVFNGTVNLSDEDLLRLLRPYAAADGLKIDAERRIDAYGAKTWEFEASDEITHRVVRFAIFGSRIFEIKTDVVNWSFLKKSRPDRVSQFEKETARFFGSFKILLPPTPTESVVPITTEVLGHFDGEKYINKFLGFSLTIPENLGVLPAEEIDRLLNTGLKALQTDDARTNNQMNRAAKKEIILLLAKNETDAKLRLRMITVSAIQLSIGVTDAATALTATRELFKANPAFSDVGDFAETELGGAKMVRFDYRVGTSLRNRMFGIVRNGFLVTFSLGTNDQDGIRELETVLKTLKFDAK